MFLNPFKEDRNPDTDTTEQISHALNGDLKALEQIVLKHQAWIYNIVLRMVGLPEDAEDITQEILIKIITKLSLYDPEKAAFKTWLYRIAANHVLTMKRSKYEKLMVSTDNPHNIPPAKKTKLRNSAQKPGQEKHVLMEEMKISCYLGSLLCFDRKERLVFILGAIFEVKSTVGAEILEISPENFRKILSRSKQKVLNFMNHQCGLLDEKNPCRCSKMLVSGIDSGWLNPEKTVLHKGKNKTVKQVISEKINEETVLQYRDTIDHFQNHPFYADYDFTHYLKTLVNDSEFKKMFSV